MRRFFRRSYIFRYHNIGRNDMVALSERWIGRYIYLCIFHIDSAKHIEKIAGGKPFQFFWRSFAEQAFEAV